MENLTSTTKNSPKHQHTFSQFELKLISRLSLAGVSPAHGTRGLVPGPALAAAVGAVVAIVVVVAVAVDVEEALVKVAQVVALKDLKILDMKSF